MNVMVGSIFGRKYEFIIRSGVTVTTTAGIFVTANPKLCNIIGYVFWYVSRVQSFVLKYSRIQLRRQKSKANVLFTLTELSDNVSYATIHTFSAISIISTQTPTDVRYAV